jgi:hypothetical protein
MSKLKQLQETELGAETKILLDCFSGADGGVSFSLLKTYFEYIETYPEEGTNREIKAALLKALKALTGTLEILNRKEN